MPTKKDMERLADMTGAECTRSIQAERAICIIATARMFGLGKKRAKMLADMIDNVSAQFSQYGREGIYYDKMKEELEMLGIEPGSIFYEPRPVKRVIRDAERKERPNLTLREQIDLENQYKQFAEFMKAQEQSSEAEKSSVRHVQNIQI